MYNNRCIIRSNSEWKVIYSGRGEICKLGDACCCTWNYNNDLGITTSPFEIIEWVCTYYY